MVQTIKLKISGMHCTSCAMNIDGSLEDAPGVLKASTSYAKQEVTVEFENEKIDIEKIKQTIKGTGYMVE